MYYHVYYVVRWGQVYYVLSPVYYVVRWGQVVYYVVRWGQVYYVRCIM